MKSYQDRFRERYQHSLIWENEDEHQFSAVEDILAFIDEVVSEERESGRQVYLTREEAYQKGRAEEREELAAHVEAHAGDFKEYDDEFARGFKHATDVFLAHLRQSDAPQGDSVEAK